MKLFAKTATNYYFLHPRQLFFFSFSLYFSLMFRIDKLLNSHSIKTTVIINRFQRFLDCKYIISSKSRFLNYVKICEEFEILEKLIFIFLEKNHNFSLCRHLSLKHLLAWFHRKRNKEKNTISRLISLFVVSQLTRMDQFMCHPRHLTNLANLR